MMAVGFVGFVVGNSRGDDARTKRQRHGSHSHPQIAIEQDCTSNHHFLLQMTIKRILKGFLVTFFNLIFLDDYF